LSFLAGTWILVILAPIKAPNAPATRRGIAREKFHWAVERWGIRDEKEGKVTAKAFIPAATFALNPTSIKVGIRRNPGPTPRKPLRMEIGTARIRVSLKFSLPGCSLTGLKSLYAR